MVLCEGTPSVTDGLSKGPVMQNFDVFIALDWLSFF